MSKEHIHCRRQSPRKQEAPRECITDGSALPGVERRPERGNKNARPGGAREAASAHAASRVRAHVRRPSLCSQAADSEVPLRQRERRDEVGRWAMLCYWAFISIYLALSLSLLPFFSLSLSLSHSFSPSLSFSSSLSIYLLSFVSVCLSDCFYLSESICVCVHMFIYLRVCICVKHLSLKARHARISLA